MSSKAFTGFTKRVIKELQIFGMKNGIIESMVFLRTDLKLNEGREAQPIEKNLTDFRKDSTLSRWVTQR